MMSPKITCLLCKAADSSELISSMVRDDPTGEFSVVRCRVCGHVQLFPLPSTEQDQRFYETDSQTRNLMGETDFSLWQAKSQADTERRIHWLDSLLAGRDRASVLDIGCGYGFFVDAAARSGYNAIGLDISLGRLALANRNLLGRFLYGHVDEAFLKQHATYRDRFQAVTLFHVLEHVHEPIQFLQQCFNLVAPSGYLLIEVPNFGDELLTQCPEYRAFFWQRAHLSYFDQERLALTLDRAGFHRQTVKGVQRYGLRNLLHWLDRGQPQLNASSFYASEPIVEHVEQLYREERALKMTSDTLIAEVRK